MAAFNRRKQKSQSIAIVFISSLSGLADDARDIPDHFYRRNSEAARSRNIVDNISQIVSKRGVRPLTGIYASDKCYKNSGKVCLVCKEGEILCVFGCHILQKIVVEE